MASDIASHMASGARFVSFEGGEGCGKSTQLDLAVRWLEDRGVDVVRTREPGGSPSAETIRRLLVEGDTDRWSPVTEVLLHAAARTEHLDKTVRPALERGAWVLTDRYADSTMAYQGGGHGIDPALIASIHELTTGGLKPDMTLVFDLPVEEGLRRAGIRADTEDRYERMGTTFHERVRQTFLSIAEAEPARCRIIDAAGDVQAVHAAVTAALAELDIS